MAGPLNWGDQRLPERFWLKVVPVPECGCWLWIGATTSRGYGSFNLGRRSDGRQRTAPAHKVAWRAAGGKFPRTGSRRGVLDHYKCQIRCCCNPLHVEAVAEHVNIRRGTSPSAIHARKTHCPRGHEYTRENTYTLVLRSRQGATKKRYCRACRGGNTSSNEGVTATPC